MRIAVLALLVAVSSATAVLPAFADAPRTGSFEDAGRAVDQLTGRLGALGAELAQQMQQGMQRGRDAMDAMSEVMRGRMMTGPDRPLITIMLHHRADLGLNPEQVTRLETLRGEFARDAIRREADIRIAELDLAGLLAQEPMDLPKVEAKVREVAQLRADLRIARLRAIEQGKTVLTPEQRTRLQGLLASMPHHQPGGPATPAPTPRRDAGLGPSL